MIGASLAREGRTGLEVGLVLGSLLAGSALASLLLARRADRLGRRTVYALLFGLMAVSGTVFALSDSVSLLIIAGLTGTIAVEVIESGPFTSVEQAMIPEIAGRDTARAFGRYNAVAALAGSAGALAAGGPAAVRDILPLLAADRRWLLVYPVVAVIGVALVHGLSDEVEAARTGSREPGGRLGTSRGPVLRLAGLFAVDSFAGGFVVQSFIVYWFTERFSASTELMGATLAATGLIQAASFVVAPRIAGRFGLLNTMVFTHLPSNLILMAIPFAPTLPVALGLLLLRYPLSQMDVPARQAHLALLAGPDDRATAASLTNAARTVARPLSAPFAGLAVGAGISGLPFVLGGGLKTAYDLVLLTWFRRVPVERRERELPGAITA
jgi:predicted MFS family arabinose efflux permease